MKKFKKLFGMFTSLLVILGGVNLISCSDSDDEETEYSISVADSDKEITLAPGGSKTISVTTDGTMIKPTSTDDNVATATLDNSKKTITITAASGITETKTAEITVKLNEDSSKSVTIKVTVSPDSENQGDTMTLTFTLSNNVDASKIKIHYYNADINDDELTDSIGKTETKTFENKSASFTILSSQASSWGCNALVYIYDSSDNDITSTLDKISVSGGSDDGTGTSTFDGADVRKVWFGYTKDSTVTVTLDKDTEIYTQLVDPISVTDASTLYQIVAASKFQEANPSKVKIELSDITYTSEQWITLATDSNWGNQITGMQSTKTETLDYSSNKAFMAGLLSNGLYIGAASGVTCTVKVSYIAGESKTPGSFTVTAGTATTETIPLTWTASENAQYYTVQYKTSDATDYTTAGTATETSYTVSGLSANTTYTILVTAYNGANGTAAEAVSATTAEDTKTYTFPYETSYTADGSLIKILPASAFTDKTVNQLTIKVSSVSYTGTDSVWLTAAGDTTWTQQASLSASGDDYTVTVTTSDFITAVKTNGLYLAGNSGLTGTVTVSYLEEEATVPATQTFTIKFSGFTIVGGNVEGVKYSNTYAESSSSWTTDQITTPTVTVAEDGASATFPVTKESLTDKNEFYIDWTGVTFKDSSSNAVTVSGLTDANKWYSFADTDSLTITASKPSELITSLTDDTASISFTTQTSPYKIVAYDAIKNYSTVTVTVSNVEYSGTSTGTKNFTVYSNATSWDNDTGKLSLTSTDSTYTGTITTVSNYSSDGIYIYGWPTGMTATLTVTGTTSSTTE